MTDLLSGFSTVSTSYHQLRDPTEPDRTDHRQHASLNGYRRREMSITHASTPRTAVAVVLVLVIAAVSGGHLLPATTRMLGYLTPLVQHPL